MLHLLLGVDLVVLSQILDDIYIESVFHDEPARPRGLCITASLVYRLKHRQIVLAAAVIVVFTKGRSRVYDSRTVFRTDIVHACYYECVLAVFDLAERFDLLVGPELHVAALDLFNNFVFFACQNLVRESLGYPKQITLVLSVLHAALDIVDVRADCERYV